MLFYLDEDLPPRAAAAARARRTDAVSSHECSRNGLSDEEQMRLAAGEGRCFVTRNRDDFITLTVQHFEAGLPHAGLLIVTRALAQVGPEAIGLALAAYATQHPTGVPSYTVDYLHA